MTEATPNRARCNECGQYPTLVGGRLRNHNHPWHHPNYGHPCPGSGTQIHPLPGQQTLTLEETSSDDSSSFSPR